MNSLIHCYSSNNPHLSKINYSTGKQQLDHANFPRINTSCIINLLKLKRVFVHQLVAILIESSWNSLSILDFCIISAPVLEERGIFTLKIANISFILNSRDIYGRFVVKNGFSRFSLFHINLLSIRIKLEGFILANNGWINSQLTFLRLMLSLKGRT